MLIKPIIITCDHPECPHRHDLEMPVEIPYGYDEWLGQIGFSLFYKKDDYVKPIYTCDAHSPEYDDNDDYVRIYPKPEP